MSYRMFDYLVPNVNFFGPNAISVVGERCKLLGGKKALLVTDKGLRVRAAAIQPHAALVDGHEIATVQCLDDVLNAWRSAGFWK